MTTELARQNEAQDKQAHQSEANVCQRKCNPLKSRLSIAHETQKKLGVAFYYIERNTNKTEKYQ